MFKVFSTTNEFIQVQYFIRNISFWSLFVLENACELGKTVQRWEKEKRWKKKTRLAREFMESDWKWGKKEVCYLCFKMSRDKFSLDFTGHKQISRGHSVLQEWKMVWCWCVLSGSPQAPDLDLAVTFAFCLTGFCLCVGCAHRSQSHSKESHYLWRLSIYAYSG